jgi:acyl dehydratase
VTTEQRQRPSTWGKITDEEMARIAQRFAQWRTNVPWWRECTRDAFEHYALGVGNANPLYQDPEYAAKSRWQGSVAHPLFLDSFMRRAGRGGGGFPGVHATHASLFWEFFRPVRIGDRITQKSAMWEHYLMPSRFAGRMLDVVNRHVWVDETNGKLVANNWGLAKRWEREAARERRDTSGPHAGWKRHVFTPEELQQLWEDYDKITIRGAEPRYWEDVQVGDKVDPYITMPYVGREIISYYMGTGAPFMMSNSIMYNYLKRHPGANVPDQDTQTPDVPERTHYDRDFARFAGFPDMYDVLQPRSGYGTTMITNWMGDDAFLRELSMLGRRPVAYGDVCWIHGQVTEKFQRGAENLVRVVMCYDTQKWRASWGHALVSLPSRERGPVVLPEAPPDPETEPYNREKPTPDYAKDILYQPEPDLPDGARIKD